MSDEDDLPDDCIPIEVEEPKTAKKDGPFHLNVNVEINVAEIICAFLLPPTVGAIAYMAARMYGG